MELVLWVLLALAWFAPFAAAQGNGTTEAPDESYALKKLRQELLATRQYDRVSRPVKNHLTQTKVDMRITINEFVELDTINSQLVTDAWFHISWRDELLTWDPADYQQLRQIHLAPHELWKPDIVLINTADRDNLLNVFTESEVVVNSTGDVLWITMGLLRSKCPVWAYDYPFNVRPVNCRLTFCSLIYESHEVNITTPGNEFLLEGPWFVNPRLQFINVTGERYERAYEGYGRYSFESLTVQLKRRDNALPLIVRIPTLTSIVLVLCMFFLPVTWPLRAHLALVAILIQLLLILYIGLQLGVNAIGLVRPVSYLRDDLFMSSLALVVTLAARRLLALADSLPALPYAASSLLAGPLARLLCFGLNTGPEQAPAGSGAPFGAGSSFGVSVLSPGSAAAAAAAAAASGPHSHVSLKPDSADRVALVEPQLDDDMLMPLATGLARGQLSGAQREWAQLITFADRVMFVFYALLMLPRLM